ncbi:hypothetical protein N7495_008790 [Penicillium taxi]|uniref:uncharacterized protein n=1 Tax=Penicillium taxi TaxID=168475 RepID=UPI002544EAC8|nr:uncharacterized protein N7495_008790 [Penicillium taxi]KAJ5888749.1 hypothetical protein N7495_008790 [Penicillium taxi]
MSSSRSSGKRLPISCQACRTRKIRCSRDGRPCQTCVRRGLGAEDCVYLGQPRLSADHTVTGDTAVQNELLARIRNLEGMLQKQMNTQDSTSASDEISPFSGSFSDSGFDGMNWSASNATMGSIGNLQTSPSGHVRYVPIASLWESVVATSPAAECLRNSDSDVTDDDDLHIPLLRDATISRVDLLALLPPSSQCDALKDVYFRVFSPVFHLLHEMTFDAEYQQFYHDPGSVSLAWLALLFAILAIGVSALDDDDPLLQDLGRERTVSRNIKVLSARYRSASLRCLAADSVMTRHSINSFQTLILVSYARLHRGLTTWTLLGLTHHIAISMGCHIDPDRFTLGLIEREERRRAWACLMILFSIQNTAFGSLNQQMFAQQVRMPADVDDIDLLTTPSLPYASDYLSSCSPTTARPTQTTFILLNITLYKLASKVCENIFNHNHPARTSVIQLEAEIIAFRDNCDTRYQSSNNEPLPMYHRANFQILYGQIHQLLLLLYRPTLCRFLQGEITPETCSIRSKCMESAKVSLKAFQTLNDSPEFAHYRWYASGLASFRAFHAAVVLAIGLLNPDSQAEFDRSKDILNHSLELFAALSVRSMFCSKAVPVVRQIIEVTSSQYQQAQQEQNLPMQSQSRTSFAAAIPITGSVPDGYSLSHQSLSPVPTASSSASDIGGPSLSSSFGMQLNPQNWLVPNSVPWDTIGSTIATQYGFERMQGSASLS